MVELYESKTVKTRKSHNCDYCLRSFPAGTEMEYEHGIFEGDFFSRYACPDCAKHTQGFWEYCDYICSDCYENFREYILDNEIDHPAFQEGLDE